jgi:acetyltransferase-like isoleucine patch superfamily enzyme
MTSHRPASERLREALGFLASDLSIVRDCVRLGPESRVDEFCALGEGWDALPEDQRLLTIGPRARIRTHAVIYAGSTIGADFHAGHHVLIREMSILGDRVSIGSGSIVEHHVRVGDDVRLHSACFVPEFSVLEDNCWLGPGVILTNAKHPLSRGVKDRLHGPVIGKGAKIGAGAVILPGVRIGEGALIGAGAIVAADVPPKTVVRGEPARVRGEVGDLRDEHGRPVYE